MKPKKCEWHPDERGLLTVIDKGDLPFVPQRIFWVEAPRGTMRGGHAHKATEQLLIAVKGVFLVSIDQQASEYLTSGYCWYVAPGQRVDYEFLTDDAVLVVLASHAYDEEDYEYPGS